MIHESTRNGVNSAISNAYEQEYLKWPNKGGTANSQTCIARERLPNMRGNTSVHPVIQHRSRSNLGFRLKS